MKRKLVSVLGLFSVLSLFPAFGARCPDTVGKSYPEDAGSESLASGEPKEFPMDRVQGDSPSSPNSSPDYARGSGSVNEGSSWGYSDSGRSGDDYH